MSKLATKIPMAAVVATALMAAPSGASGATQIGQTFTPATDCLAGNTRLQHVSPGDEYAAPTDGVITRWNFQADASPPQLKFKVARPTGNPNEFTMIGQSAVVFPNANLLNSYPIQIPVQAGDIIGTFTPTTGRCISAQTGYSYLFIGSDVQPPTMATFPSLAEGWRFDLSATLEPDCDSDSLGDETQDPDISSCPAPPPPDGPGPSPSPPPPPGQGPSPVEPEQAAEPEQATATCKGKSATIVGTDGANQIAGTAAADVIAALGGNDTVAALAGNDVVCGGPGKDTLKGGKGKDTLLGQKGKDKLKGGGGKDVCKGGKGKDTASKCEVEKSI